MIEMEEKNEKVQEDIENEKIVDKKMK